MPFRTLPSFAIAFAAFLVFFQVGFSATTANAQSPGSSSSGSQQSSSEGAPQREKAPSLVDPAGPTISLVSSEPVFVMAAALNVCGYDDGLEESAPIRKRANMIGKALAYAGSPIDRASRSRYIIETRISFLP